ncbi:MAG: hypothetical protein KF857_08170 [Fimbriimonadaceae bacterium]|nr:hypothetical protein [Fimbriimonadaceae bacterium]
MKWVTLVPLALVAGCQAGDDALMPLGTGKVWQYQVTSGLTSGVQEVKVVGPTSVGPYSGWSLRGDGAETRLAWAGRRLVAAELAGTTYSPPLPLVDPDAMTKVVEWDGQVDSGAGPQSVKATLKLKQDKDTVGNRRVTVTMADIVFSNGDEALVWFAPHIGVVRQEQRRKDRLVAKLVYLSGP